MAADYAQATHESLAASALNERQAAQYSAAMTLRAVLFDAFGTLFDVHSVMQRADNLYPGQGAALSQRWRDKQIEYTRLVSMSGAQAGERYEPFEALTRSALRHAAASLGLKLDEAAERALMAQYRALSPFPENRAVLEQLAARGVRCGVLSNGDPDLLGAVVAHAGFAPLLNPVLSVHPARRYKTDAAAYAIGTAALGLPAADILFVSSNGWDAYGATCFGYTTLWINRTGAPAEGLLPAPTHQGRTLADVLPLL
jgi:2-haloacid dehalogenase